MEGGQFKLQFGKLPSPTLLNGQGDLFQSLGFLFASRQAVDEPQRLLHDRLGLLLNGVSGFERLGQHCFQMFGVVHGLHRGHQGTEGGGLFIN